MDKQKVETQGVKEVRDGVAIAALSAVFTGLITWGFDELKAFRKARAEKKSEASNA